MKNTCAVNGRKFIYWNFQVVHSIERSHEAASCGDINLEEHQRITQEGRTPSHGCAKTLFSRLGRRKTPPRLSFDLLLPVVTHFERLQIRGGIAQ